MKNKKKEVVLLSINEVNFLNRVKWVNDLIASTFRKKWATEPVAPTSKVIFLLFLIIFLFSNCHKNPIPDDNNSEIELKLMESGSIYLKKGGYEEANMIYTKFIVKYPEHPYVDDAAYRLAYMSVIADIKNPYFDYNNAVTLFEKFIENYPNSRYINACNNWINLLKAVKINNDKSSVASTNNQSDSIKISQLIIELKRVQAENTKLKNTLDELQKAIER